MSADRQNDHDVDKLLRRVLRDDLPSEAEFRMRKRLAVLRRALESPGDSHAARSAESWRHTPVFEQWRPWRWLFRKEVLAYASAVMLAAGAVIHLGGYHSLLADSISLLKTSISLTEQMRLAGTMDCVINMPAAGTQVTTYHIRWVREGGTRVDVEFPRGIDETLWIIQGRVTIANTAVGSLKPAANPVPDLQEPVRALLAPADLARKLDGSWQLQPEKQHNPDRLVFVDRQDRAVIEVHLDTKTFLPISLSRKPPEAGGRGGTGGVATTAEFTWNQPVAPDLMVPRLKPER
jgi:hypothetical protein